MEPGVRDAGSRLADRREGAGRRGALPDGREVVMEQQLASTERITAGEGREDLSEGAPANATPPEGAAPDQAAPTAAVAATNEAAPAALTSAAVPKPPVLRRTPD